ncbi:MAG TPA: DUF4259 domain-containing protein [Nocardioidaceae bacterium]|nr:DUF4259 domain-containing protein [Nocardioidaceae bacterium]
MGTWGNGPFDNDDASDWVYKLEDSGVSALRSALAVEDGYLKAPQAAEAVAAATVVGLASDLPVESTEEVSEWLGGADADEVRSFAGGAVVALERVLEDSELAELYDESGDEEWRQQVRALHDGLRG